MKQYLNQTTKVCSGCNSQNELDARFCTRCGRQIYEQKVLSGLKSIKSNKTLYSILIISGAINVILWFIIDAEDKTLFTHYFSEIKALLWITLHGRLIIGITLLFIGTIVIIINKPVLFLISKSVLFISGFLNIIIDFLAVPALKEYDIIIGLDIILNDLSNLWLIIGFLQIILFSFLVLKKE